MPLDKFSNSSSEKILKVFYDILLTGVKRARK